jgi:hypothetical protein
VRPWRLRTIGVILLTALAGGPMADVVCDVGCATAGHDREAHTTDPVAVAGHDHHAVPGTGANVAAARASLTGQDGPETCRVPAQTPVSLIAVRADRSLVSIQQPAGLLPIAAPSASAPALARSMDGGPPGPTSPALASPVLRI